MLEGSADMKKKENLGERRMEVDLIWLIVDDSDAGSVCRKHLEGVGREP